MKKPLQVCMDEADLERLSTWARDRGWTKSSAVRAAIQALMRLQQEDPLLAASGMIDGLTDDLGSHFDRYLEETFLGFTS